MDQNRKDKDRYDTVIREASKAYFAKQYSNALQFYSEALKLAPQVNVSRMIVNVIKYMMASCLVESETLDDLAEAIMILQTLDLSTKKRFPAIFYILARAHIKLFRFKEAYQVLLQGEEIYRGLHKTLLEVYYIPGTNKVINQDVESESWKKLKDDCTAYYPPDAICFFKECSNVTKPYTTPNRSIYYRDPAFNGMVVLKCNNTKRQCTLKYHQHCWKVQKDTLYPVEKVSDKDLIGHPCLTENCRSGKNVSTISYIEIIASNGTSKAHIQGPTVVAPGSTTKKVTENETEKVKQSSTAKSHISYNQLKENKQNISSPKKETYQENELIQSYQDYIVIPNEEFEGKVSFTFDPPDVAQKKEFLLSIFENYIKKNLVRVCDIYSKYAEYSDYVSLPHLDILNFLLSTGKVKILDDFTQIPNSLSQDENVFEEVLDNYYDQLMSDVEDSGVESQNKKKESKVDENSYEKHAVDKAGGDAPPFQKIPNKPSNDAPPGTPTKSVQQNNELERKVTESKKLKEYITQLEYNMKEMMNENENFKRELINKNSDIDLLKKQLEDNNEKWKLLEEKIVSFKQNYENVKKENFTLKTEVIELIQCKQELEDKQVALQEKLINLEEKILECTNPEKQEKDLLKNFEDEYIMLEEKLNSEWTTKSEKMVKDALDKELEVRLSLLKKCLNNQYSDIRNLINRYMDLTNYSLDSISKMNDWMAKTMEVRQFLDNNDWLVTKSFCTKALADVQEEYQVLTKILHDEESTEKYKMQDINLTYPKLPPMPKENAGDYALKALNTFYDRQRTILQSLQQPNYIKPPLYPTPPQYYPSNYPQILAPPGMQPMHIRPPGFATPSATTLNYNALSQINASLAAQYKHMQEQLQTDMQQRMQDLQLELQQMRKDLEQNNQVSYPESPSSSNKSATKEIAEDSSVQIIPIEQEPQEQPKPSESKEYDLSYATENGVKVIYDTGSRTGSIIGDTDSIDSKENFQEREQSTPLRKPFNNSKSLNNGHEQSASLKMPADDLSNWLGKEEDSAPLDQPIDEPSSWNGREEQSTSPKKTVDDLQYHEISQQNTCYEESNETLQDWDEELEPPAISHRSISRLQHWEKEEKPIISRVIRRPSDLQHWEEDLKTQNKDCYVENDENALNDEENDENQEFQQLFYQPKPIENVVKHTTKIEKEFEDNLVMKYLLQDSSEERREKRPNLDALINRLKAKYPGALEADIIFIISEVRKRHNNSLSGLSVRQIIEESEEYFTNNQHIHLIPYVTNGTVESPAKPSGLQRGRNDSGSSSSYCTASRGPASVRSSVNSPRKTWNTLPQEEVKWVCSYEMDCSICTNKVTANTCYTLNCGHSYHKQCAKLWFKTQRTCPNCRTPVVEEDEFPPLPI